MAQGHAEEQGNNPEPEIVGEGCYVNEIHDVFCAAEEGSEEEAQGMEIVEIEYPPPCHNNQQTIDMQQWSEPLEEA